MLPNRMRRAPRSGPLRRWGVVASPDQERLHVGLEAMAMTKSEARAVLKRRLGLKRLPAGAVLEEIK